VPVPKSSRDQAQSFRASYRTKFLKQDTRQAIRLFLHRYKAEQFMAREIGKYKLGRCGNGSAAQKSISGD
jgi:hypothetical protein